MSTSSTSQSASRSRGTQGTVNLREVRHAISGTRSTFTRVRTRRNDHPTAEQTGSQADFVTLVSLVCNIYQNSEHDLIPVQQFHPDAERHEDGGHTCIVSQRAISTSAASKYKRGATDSLAEDIVVKRTRQSVLEPQSSGLKSLINELSIRTHPPIRNHPNIVKFKGIAWDFEDDEATKPRPLLLEELAPQRSLEGFWTKYKFVRMTFQSNIELCLDIAQGLAALHACRIVHGDVKPENILVFPRIGHQDSFMAKLTDFGHSTSAHEKRTTLPAFTPQWCAPEVLVDDHHLEFSGMIATDVYSFGLVVLSIIVGRSYYLSIDDFTTLKQDGTMFGRAMLLVEQEDRQSHDSDFELDTIRSLLRATIRHDSARRSLPRCTRILKRYLTTRSATSSFSVEPNHRSSLAKLRPLDISQAIEVGYQTLALCSHQLKERITRELELIAKNTEDPRNPAAAWEVSICYFSGFGVSRDFERSSYWLNVAYCRGVPGALKHGHQIHKAMHSTSGFPTRHDNEFIAIECSHQQEFSRPSDHVQNTTAKEAETGLLVQHGSLHKLDAAEELQDLQLEEEFTGTDSDSNSRSDTSEVPERGNEIGFDRRICEAITDGQPATLMNLVRIIPEWQKLQDKHGNSMILVAARSGSFECIEVLLDHPSADASIYNDFQESALHFMSNFREAQFQALIPKLIARGADPHHEALPMHLQDGKDPLSISTKVRCCSVLRAILSDHLALLSCLLEASHSSGSPKICRICEGGSKLKRIIALALSTFRAEALRTIVDHMKAYGDDSDVSFSSIEVWSNQELIPLWKTPFRSDIVRETDLPESFFRAISCGDKSVEVLRTTIEFLLDHFAVDSKQLYNMLQEAVNANSLDSVNLILEEAQRRELPSSWWLAISKTAFPENPLITAIKHGLRSVFNRLCASHSHVFRDFVHISDAVEPSKIARLFPKSSALCTKSYHINVAQICLSIAVTAAHQDPYFFNFILDHASRKFIIQEAGLLDHEISNHPTCFLAQAILTSSFSAATTILQKFPEAWQHRVRLQSTGRRKNRQTTLSVMNMFPDIYLDPSSSRYSNWFYDWFYSSPLTGGEYWTILSPTLPEYILLVGSYNHCRFLLSRLHRLRVAKHNARPFATKSQPSLASNEELGISEDWQRCQLTFKEFWCLMLGNLVREREDREQLWDVIRVQVSCGHAKKMVYMRLAIRHGTNKALIRLLDMGWQVNGPFWAYFMTPYRLATRMERQARLLRSYHAPIGWDSPRWGDLDTHKGVFEEYKKEQEKIHANYGNLAAQNSATLKERGGRMPGFVLWFRNDRFYLWAVVLYYLLYALFLPVLLAYVTGPYWRWRQTSEYKLLWMYVWSIVTVFSPPARLFNKEPSFFTSEVIWTQSLLIIQLVMQHLAPLLVITTVEFHSLNGMGWFVPFCVIGPEMIIVLVGLLLYALGTAAGAVLDGCWALISYCCGRGFSPGPFGIF